NSTQGVGMYSNIVVGTDGSETAAMAVEIAAGLARRDGATLHLVTVTKQPTGVAGGPLAGGEPLSGAGFSLLGGEEMLAEVAAGIEGVQVKLHAATGNPAAVIVRVAEEVGADLIVVGSKGMTRRVLGSVPNSVAHSAGCDVLIAKTA
ncbi:MAG: universal stress protein, partial [Acidimicrobiales bacterium]